MKKVLTILMAALLFANVAFCDVYVHGYYRRDGTYVRPHWRSDPDGNPYNNWSYRGNVNPYTGKIGTKRYNDYGNHYNNYNNQYGNGYQNNNSLNW